ncbi:hypothetical protein B0J13DRAFT_608329 [Dactylonectria estremocensis]|uniref:Uncharacterized protein n=1 Tax=Dactylonectria estremocensis TaxID=1079267 RepID=A0A9P9J0Z1_9HYPO|nr:hypothetical protein B0J13DRAFT_608329 [Dactylonectria estremocensis]
MVHGGAINDRLAARFVSTAPTHDDQPRFEVFSYVWGSEDKPSQVTVTANGDASREFLLGVIQNLKSMLQHLRYIDRDCHSYRMVSMYKAEVKTYLGVFEDRETGEVETMDPHLKSVRFRALERKGVAVKRCVIERGDLARIRRTVVDFDLV